jgi:iron complex transport system permease protein
VLLGNPLADPYVLGVSGGAAVGALLALFLGLAGIPVTLAALAGALVAIVLVFGLAGRGGPARLLLTGVVIAAGWGAAISFLLAIAPEHGLRSMVFWLMGDLSQMTSAGVAYAVLAAGLALTLPLARDLNLLARGELQAGALGVDVKNLRVHLYLVASLLTAAAVTLGGNIGFVGLVVPHLVRLVTGADHRVVLPASVLLGGALLVVADTLARTAVAPQQLPVGVLTAFIGVPVFLLLLARGTRT